MQNFEFHPAASAFPMLAPDLLEDLSDDIRVHGLRHPVVLCEGRILDGRNRYLACRAAGVDLRTEIFTGDPWAYAWSANGARRDLVAEQRYIIYADCMEHSAAWQAEQERVRAEANAKRAEAAKAQIAEQPRDESGKVVSRVSPHNEGRPGPPRDRRAERERETSTAKARLAGVSRGSAERAEQLRRNNPDLAAQVAAGTMKPAEAHRQAKKAALPQKIAALPEGKFTVVYADPPWQYNDSRATGDGYEATAAATHYPTMPLTALKAMAVKDLAAPDCTLFCWATFPLLPDALSLISAWGFKYKTAFVWGKPAGSFGHYHDASAELLIVATIGGGVTQADGREKQIQLFPRAGHSRKPREWRAMIDRMYPHGRRIELFARGAVPANWTAWGNEA